MLVVRVEIWPGGWEWEGRELGRLALANVSGLAEVSDYVAVLVGPDARVADRVVFGHRRSDGFWALIGRALDPLDPSSGPVPAELEETAAEILRRLVNHREGSRRR